MQSVGTYLQDAMQRESYQCTYSSIGILRKLFRGADLNFQEIQSTFK